MKKLTSFLVASWLALAQLSTPVVVVTGVFALSTQTAEAQLTRTNRISSASADTFGTGAYTSASFTPTPNSLVVVTCFGIDETADVMEGTTLTATDSVGSTFTSEVATNSSPGWGYGHRQWTTLAGSSPAARTVSCDAGATNVHAYRMWIDDFTGFDTGDPTDGAVVGTDADGNGAASVTLAEAPAAGDFVYGVASTGISGGSPSMTQGATFTERLDVTSAGWANWHIESVTGVTSTTVDWVDLNAGAGTNLGGTLSGLIIRVASGGGGGTGIIKKRRSH